MRHLREEKSPSRLHVESSDSTQMFSKLVELVEHLWTDPSRAHRYTCSLASSGHRRTDMCRSVASRRCTV